MKYPIGQLFATFLVLSSLESTGQTNPVPQQVPMSQDFGNMWFTGSALPPGIAVWRITGSPSTTLLSASNSSANGDEVALDSATVVKSPGKAYGYSGIGSGNINVNNGQLYIQTSSSATSGTDQLVLAVKTTGFTNVRVSFEVEMLNPQPKKAGIVFQYRLGTSGSWTTIDSSYHHNNSDRIQNQIDYFVNFSLGSNANNQNVVQLRWAFCRDAIPSGGGSSGVAIDNIVVSADPLAPPQYFRSIASGNWNSLSTWEASLDGISWYAATAPPSAGDLSVVIRSPHFVNSDGIVNLVIDELKIDAGATFRNSWGTALAIEDGISPADLQVNGTFEDSSNVSVIWVNTARWQLGNSGTYVKTYNTNSTNWQLKYYNGISTIPSTSNWICRKPAGANVEPSISTTNGGPPNPQATFGNLFIENYSGTWNSNNLCKFSGSNNTPLIKGNFYIGGNGPNSVSYLCINTFVSPIKVLGNIIIANGNTLRNEGTGIDLSGNLICNGLLTYGSSTSTLFFTGSTAQTISGNGTVSTWKFDVNKNSGNLNVLLSSSIYGNINLMKGIVNTSALSLLKIQDNATSTNASNLSFINGPLIKIGDDAFTFPVGKNNLLRAIGINVGTANINDVFTAEYFYQNPQVVYGSAIDPSLDHISSCEYWTLNQNVGSSLKNVTLSWSSNSCGVTLGSDLRVARWNSSYWYNEGSSATSGNNAAGIVTSNTTTGFGPFTLASITTQNPLPIQLISFSAEIKNNSIYTQWLTSSEINNDYFTLEKSKDGIHFVAVGIVKGAGNSTRLLDYEYSDENPYNGISYYRLKQTDFDGKFSYSDLVPVKIKNCDLKIISVNPNYENNIVELKINFPRVSTAQIIIQDLNGRPIIDVNFRVEPKIFSLPIMVNLPHGIYILQVIDENEYVYQKFYY